MTKHLLPLLIMLQCSIRLFGQDSYSIGGNINGVENGTKVYLLKFLSNQIDSTIVMNSLFSFKGELKEPVEAAIVFSSLNNVVEKEKRKTFWLENSEIEISGSSGSLPAAAVSGSVSNEDYESYLDELYNRGKVTLDNYSDSLKTALTIKYIESHPDAYKSAMELYLYRQIISLEKVKSLYSAFTDKVKVYSFSALLLDFINQYRQLKVGDYAPDFTMTSVSGKSVQLSSYRGKYVLVEFWGSWCAPCRGENIKLKTVYEKYKDRGFEILGIGLDTKAALQKAIQRDGIKWTTLIDEKQYDSQVAHMYGIWAVPQNFLINPEGKIIAVDLRETTGMVSQKLEEVLTN